MEGRYLFLNNYLLGIAMETQFHSWISIIPHEVIKKTQEKQFVSLVTMLAKVSLEAIQLYENLQLGHLDALVGNYGCEVHAFNMLSLAHPRELEEECKSLKSTCHRIEEWLRQSQSINEVWIFDQAYTKLEAMARISPGMMYLIKSRMLTITKEFKHDAAKFDTREYEDLNTKQNKLRNLIQDPGLSISKAQAKKIVSIAQSSMSESSIQLMRAKLEQLMVANGKEDTVLRAMMLPENLCPPSQDNGKKTYSCAYYNTKALLMLLATLKASLIVKKMTKMNEPVQHFDFKSCGEFGKFQEMTTDEIKKYPDKDPVIVCQAYIPDKISRSEWLRKVNEYGLGNMILAGAAQGDQYVPRKPEFFPIPLTEAADEIKYQSEVKARELECLWMNGIFDLEHFYCSSWKDRGKNLGELEP